MRLIVGLILLLLSLNYLYSEFSLRNQQSKRLLKESLSQQLAQFDKCIEEKTSKKTQKTQIVDAQGIGGQGVNFVQNGTHNGIVDCFKKITIGMTEIFPNYIIQLVRYVQPMWVITLLLGILLLIPEIKLTLK